MSLMGSKVLTVFVFLSSSGQRLPDRLPGNPKQDTYVIHLALKKKKSPKHLLWDAVILEGMGIKAMYHWIVSEDSGGK